MKIKSLFYFMLSLTPLLSHAAKKPKDSGQEKVDPIQRELENIYASSDKNPKKVLLPELVASFKRAPLFANNHEWKEIVEKNIGAIVDYCLYHKNHLSLSKLQALDFLTTNELFPSGKEILLLKYILINYKQPYEKRYASIFKNINITKEIVNSLKILTKKDKENIVKDLNNIEEKYNNQPLTSIPSEIVEMPTLTNIIEEITRKKLRAFYSISKKNKDPLSQRAIDLKNQENNPENDMSEEKEEAVIHEENDMSEKEGSNKHNQKKEDNIFFEDSVEDSLKQGKNGMDEEKQEEKSVTLKEAPKKVVLEEDLKDIIKHKKTKPIKKEGSNKNKDETDFFTSPKVEEKRGFFTSPPTKNKKLNNLFSQFHNSPSDLLANSPRKESTDEKSDSSKSINNQPISQKLKFEDNVDELLNL